jgi:hypothetical protein
MEKGSGIGGTSVRIFKMKRHVVVYLNQLDNAQV